MLWTSSRQTKMLWTKTCSHRFKGSNWVLLVDKSNGTFVVQAALCTEASKWSYRAFIRSSGSRRSIKAVALPSWRTEQSHFNSSSSPCSGLRATLLSPIQLQYTADLLRRCPVERIAQNFYYGNFITTEKGFKRFDVSLDVFLVCLCVNAQVLMQLESALCPVPLLKNGWLLMKVDIIHNGMIPAPHCLCVLLCQRWL